MNIVIIGGTGLIGSKLVPKLRDAGHEALAASPDTGVNTLTGEGLTEALEGAQVVVDVANAPNWDDAAVLDFFQTSSRNVVAAETAAGVKHHVTLSLVGADRLADSGYMRATSAPSSTSTRSPRAITPRIAPTHFEDWLSRSTTEGRAS
jgi:uncharacterized protein YbjT (DUF2867 family)